MTSLVKHRSINRLLWTYGVFAVAMAYLEATVVVYLRLLYYPEGFYFPMKIIPLKVAAIELGREAATLVMLWYVARMAGKSFREKFSLFAFTFGVWDIFYYVWLKALVNWPVSWTDWDILFLIPAPWIAPWLAPVLVSLALIAGAVIVLKNPDRFGDKILAPKEWTGLLIGAALILASFFTETGRVLRQGIPEHYHWWLFGLGYAAGWLVFLRKWRKIKNRKRPV